MRQGFSVGDKCMGAASRLAAMRVADKKRRMFSATGKAVGLALTISAVERDDVADTHV